MWKYFLAGGPIMWPLLILSICSLAIILERFIFWQHLRMRKDLSRSQNYLAELAKTASSPLLPNGPFSAIIYAGLTHPFARTKAMESAALNWLSCMKRRMAVLDTIITASPMLGILGTVLGIIRAFESLGSSGNSNPTAITSGLSEALITTAAGLIIAILTLFPYNYFQKQIEFATIEMEKLGSALESMEAKPEKDSVKETESRTSH